MIADIVKKGKVYAVDTDDNMIANTKKNIKDFSNIVLIKPDLSDLDLLEIWDLVFTNAVIHGILDHKKIFTKSGHHKSKMERF